MDKSGKDIDAISVVVPDHSHFLQQFWPCQWVSMFM